MHFTLIALIRQQSKDGSLKIDNLKNCRKPSAFTKVCGSFLEISYLL